MRFRALIYKELRECMPIVSGLSLILLILGFMMMRFLYSTVRVAEIKPVYEVCGGYLLAFSIVLGIILSVRQFYIEFSMKLWGFLLHRSVTKESILFAKIFTGFICFIPFLSMWTIFYFYTKPVFVTPPELSYLWKGFVFAAFGYVSYLAVTLSTLSQAKWYTTKKMGIVFGLWMFIMLMIQWRLLGAWLVIIISASILLIQITDLFLNREFE
ncbi:MAG: hypothetical protein A2Y12_08340 [Planctomycetes bacterium GWF2_42_9]|nr:MAG: hypothetical protein A2Y12_08340 [Planctomycetes bacterium GWF2_42_9]HAL44420.1 hypothetical protein [Phycisphaerales bacterium]